MDIHEFWEKNREKREETKNLTLALTVRGATEALRKHFECVENDWLEEQARAIFSSQGFCGGLIRKTERKSDEDT